MLVCEFFGFKFMVVLYILILLKISLLMLGFPKHISSDMKIEFVGDFSMGTCLLNPSIFRYQIKGSQHGVLMCIARYLMKSYRFIKNCN